MASIAQQRIQELAKNPTYSKKFIALIFSQLNIVLAETVITKTIYKNIIQKMISWLGFCTNKYDLTQIFTTQIESEDDNFTTDQVIAVLEKVIEDLNGALNKSNK